MKKPFIALMLCLPFLLANSSCDFQPDADRQMAEAQKKSLTEAQAQIGMPAIVNFQEKRMMKTLYELRDTAISTHTYILNSMQGCLIYLGPSVGFGMPYATQYSAPMTQDPNVSHYAYDKPQAEPNGLFMPSDAHGTWIMLKDPSSTDVKPVYIEPDVLVVPFRLKDKECK